MAPILQKNPKLVEEFVQICQKAYAACVADVDACLKALLDQVSGLTRRTRQRWERIKFFMTDEFTTTKGLGWIDAERMKKDYELVADLSRHGEAVRGEHGLDHKDAGCLRSRWMPAR